jgi:hypothetical protein
LLQRWFFDVSTQISGCELDPWILTCANNAAMSTFAVASI